MYLLSDFSGLAETQFPTEGDEKVALMATVGSTHRVISRSSNVYFVVRCATSSSFRTKCHSPFRKLGPSNSSALACDEIGPIVISAIKTQKHPRALPEPPGRLQKAIPIVPDCPPEKPGAAVNLQVEAPPDSTASNITGGLG